MSLIFLGEFNEKDAIPMRLIPLAMASTWLTHLLLHKGRYAGSGSNIIEASFSNGKIYVYDWLLKFLLTILTMSAGFQGGELVPLFSI